MDKVVFYSLLPLLLLSMWLQAGCSLPGSKPVVTSDPPAEAMLKQGTDLLNNKRYRSAILKFEQLREDFPFST